MAQTPRQPGRPRSSIDAAVFAATLKTVHEHGYARATVDRIAAEAGVAKTTVYRRWASKGELIVACVVDAFGPLPLIEGPRDEVLASMTRWVAEKLADPGLGAAFAGVFTDAVNDAELREILMTKLQAPYLEILMKWLGESERKVRFVIDVIIGTMLHRMGITGEPMDDEDVDTLIAMVVGVLR